MRRLVRWLFWGFLVALAVGYGSSGGSPDALKDLVRREWPVASDVVVAKAGRVSGCETRGVPETEKDHVLGDKALMAEGWGPSIGRFQIRSRWDQLLSVSRPVGTPQQGDRNPVLLLLPSYNAHAAYNISQGGANWGPWTCGGS